MVSWSDYVSFMIARGNIEALMIIDSSSGALWASSSKDFALNEYTAKIAQEDGSEKEEVVNEAANIVKFIQGGKPPQGLRISGKRQQVIRSFKDDDTGLAVIYGKVTMGGSCVTNAGRCALIATFNEASGHTSAACYDILRLMAIYLHKSVWPGSNAASAPISSTAPSSSTTAPSSAPSASSNSSSSSSSSASSSGNNSAWKALVDAKLMGKGNVLGAAICSKDDGHILAHGGTIQLKVYQADIPQEDGTDKNETVDEAKNIAMLMSRKKPPQGLRIDGVKYQILRTFDEESSGCYTVYGKKTLGGSCIAVTNKVIILAIFDEKQGHNVAGCNEAVAELAKQLKGANS